MQLQSLTTEDVLAYVVQVLPDIATPEVASLLHERTGGLRVALERQLVHWVKTGILMPVDEHWVLQRQRIEQAKQAASTPAQAGGGRRRAAAAGVAGRHAAAAGALCGSGIHRHCPAACSGDSAHCWQ